MPAIVKHLTPAGLFDVGYAASSLRDAAQYEPRAGVYTVSKTYNRTQTLLLDAHLDRLHDSATRKGIKLRCERNRLKAALRGMILESGFGDARFRISAAANAPDEQLLSIEPYRPPPPEIIAKGARCITSTAAARRDPASKSSEWMFQRQRLEAEKPADIYEILLTDARGFILEGLSSNAYIVMQGELRTAGRGVLPGISRQIVFATCERVLPLRLEPPHIGDIARFQEAFLTSSSRGIIPVVEIDGSAIGDGGVGKRTWALRAAYEAWVADHLEEL